MLPGTRLPGLLLGGILGGTAAAIILPVVSKTAPVSEPVKVLISLDPAFSEVFVVVIAPALLGTMTSEGHSVGVVRDIFHAFWDALMLAILAGAVWARLLACLQGQALPYMLTLAEIFVLYYLAGCRQSPPAAFSRRSEAPRTAESTHRLFACCGLAEQPAKDSERARECSGPHISRVLK